MNHWSWICLFVSIRVSLPSQPCPAFRQMLACPLWRSSLHLTAKLRSACLLCSALPRYPWMFWRMFSGKFYISHCKQLDMDFAWLWKLEINLISTAACPTSGRCRLSTICFCFFIFSSSSASVLLQSLWFSHRGPFGPWKKGWIHEVCRQTGELHLMKLLKMKCCWWSLNKYPSLYINVSLSVQTRPWQCSTVGL